MKKYIIITTINKPTIATKKYATFLDWNLIVVGDLKTPHKEYSTLNCVYLTPEYQDKTYRNVSNILGWNTISRRNIGFIEAYNRGADIIATVDDDNIPNDNWGKELYIGKEIECDYWDSNTLNVIDPLEVTNHKELWHRGYPIELIKDKHNIEYIGKKTIRPLIQANLWNGDPDVDAITRLIKKPIIKFDNINPFCFNKLSPFNSQNTMLAREVIPYYAVLPFVGRMDDIWGSYILQNIFKDKLIYANATVYQDRNKQDLIKNLEHEILGYRHTLEFINNKTKFINSSFIPEKTKEFFKLYQNEFK